MERAPVWGEATPLPGLCADGAVLLAQGSRAPTLDLIFHVGCTLFFCSRGCSLCASPPLLKKKTCMISYMKDICNWTAGPMQYIYNSKQNTLKPVSSFSPHFFPEEMYLHIFRNRGQKRDKNSLSFLSQALYLM